MHRRTFCILSSTGLASVLLPIASCSEDDTALQTQLSLPATLATINDTDTITGLGQAYLEQVDGENTAALLIDTLMVKPDGGAISPTTDNVTLQRLMSEKIQYDFETGATVVVKGWVLSRTEARQCALFSLTQARV